MEEVAIIALALSVAGALGVIVWLVRRGDGRVDQLLAKTTELDAAKSDILTKTLATERAQFETAQITQALTAEKARSAALEDFISADAKETDPVAPLATDDIAGRLLRFAQKANVSSPTASTGTSNQVPAVGASDVHPVKATTPTNVGGVPKP